MSLSILGACLAVMVLALSRLVFLSRLAGFPAILSFWQHFVFEGRTS